MKRMVFFFNSVLLLVVPILLIVAGLVSMKASFASTPDDCPLVFGSQYCGDVCSPVLKPAGEECGMSATEGCCSYKAWNVYCYYGTSRCGGRNYWGDHLIIAPNATCAGGVCQ